MVLLHGALLPDAPSAAASLQHSLGTVGADVACAAAAAAAKQQQVRDSHVCFMLVVPHTTSTDQPAPCLPMQAFLPQLARTCLGGWLVGSALLLLCNTQMLFCRAPSHGGPHKHVMF